MNKLLLLTIFSVALGACANQPITGTWLEPVPTMPTQTQGITLKEGGEAFSINMATLLYEHWKKEGDTLILEGKSIGNGQEIEFVSKMKIEKLNESELILSDETRTLHFTKKQK